MSGAGAGRSNFDGGSVSALNVNQSRNKDDSISATRKTVGNASNSRQTGGGLKYSKSVVGLNDNGRIPPINNRNKNEQGHTKNNLT